MTKEKEVGKESNVSMVFGIIGIITAVFVPVVGVISGIIGLSVKKNKDHYTRDVTLNAIALIFAVVVWLITWLMLLLSY